MAFKEIDWPINLENTEPLHATYQHVHSFNALGIGIVSPEVRKIYGRGMFIWKLTLDR